MSTVVLGQAPHVRLDPASAAVFALVAIGAAWLTTRRPAYGVAALVLADPFGYAHYVGWTTITIPKVVLAGVAIGLVVRRPPLGVLRSRETLAVLAGGVAIAVVTMLSAIASTYIDVVARESLKAVEYVVVFCVAAVAFASDPDETLAWKALGAVAAIVCFSALLQEFTGAPAGLMLGGRVIPRIAGLLEGPNQLAGFFDVVIPLAFARVVFDRNPWFAALLCVVLATDALTFSRAGAIGAIAGLFAVGLHVSNLKVRRTVAIAGAGCALVLGAALAKLHVLSRFLSSSDVDTASGLGSRGELWAAAWGFFRAHPILGIGAGNFELELPQAGLGGVRTHANSLYLQTLAEGGILLFAATIFTLGAAIRTFYVRAPKVALFVGVGAATIALATHQIFDLLTFFPKVGGFWWLWLGIASGSLFARERLGEKTTA